MTPLTLATEQGFHRTNHDAKNSKTDSSILEPGAGGADNFLCGIFQPENKMSLDAQAEARGIGRLRSGGSGGNRRFDGFQVLFQGVILAQTLKPANSQFSAVVPLPALACTGVGREDSV